MWTPIYINHDALARIAEDPYEFACRLLDEMSARNQHGAEKLCIAGFKPAAIIGSSVVAPPPYDVSTQPEGDNDQSSRRD
jgi:hypothetical protein